MSRAPQVGQIIAVRLGDEEYAGEVVEVTDDHVVVAVRVEHDPSSVLPDKGSITWKGKRVQAFGHAEMSCITTVRVTLPLSKPKPAQLRRRIAVDVWEKPGSNTLAASGFTQDLTGDRAQVDLNRPLPLNAPVDVTLYLPKDVLRIPALVERITGPDSAPQATLRFDPAAASRSKLTRYIFAQLRTQKG